VLVPGRPAASADSDHPARPAARVGDLAGCTAPILPPGAPTVFIGDGG
jgi:hypothetical protein